MHTPPLPLLFTTLNLSPEQLAHRTFGPLEVSLFYPFLSSFSASVHPPSYLVLASHDTAWASCGNSEFLIFPGWAALPNGSLKIFSYLFFPPLCPCPEAMTSALSLGRRFSSSILASYHTFSVQPLKTLPPTPSPFDSLGFFLPNGFLLPVFVIPFFIPCASVSFRFICPQTRFPQSHFWCFFL